MSRRPVRHHAPNTRRPLRVGAVAYLNMQPLIYGLDVGDGVRLRLGPPSRLARWLERGQVDLAMVPVAALFAHPEWSVLPGAMIGARGPVASVLVLGAGEPASWRRIHPDAQSQTSNALARILLERRARMRPAWAEPLPSARRMPPEPREGEAWVVIGTRALRWSQPWRAAGGYVLDLGQAWTEWTGLPAVFALWAARPGAPLGPWPSRLAALKRRNLRRLRRIATGWAANGEDGLTAAQAHRYLSVNVDYTFDDEARRSLARFYREGQALGLFPPGWRLRMVPANTFVPDGGAPLR